MREYISAQEDPLRNLISTIAILLLSSVITETTAFSLKHEALFGNNRNSDTSEAIAAVAGISPPLLDTAMSLFDPVDGIAPAWSVSSVLHSGKVLPPTEQFLPFKPFLPIQPFGLPPQHMMVPLNDKDNQGIVVPPPPSVPAPLQVTIVDSPIEIQSQEESILAPVEIQLPEDNILAPASAETPELDLSLEILNPTISDPFQWELEENIQSSDSSPVLEWHQPMPPPQFGWPQPYPNVIFPTPGGSQLVSMTVNGNSADITTSNNVNMQVISSDAPGEDSKHFIGSSKPGPVSEEQNSKEILKNIHKTLSKNKFQL